MDPFTIMMLASTAISAGGQLLAGKQAKDAAQLNAYNLETERTVSKAEALQRHNDRLEQYRANLSSNIASFAAMGRDVGSDRSVAAFLERQKQIASSDTTRSDFMGMMESMKLTSQAAAVRAEGRAQQQSAIIGAFTTLGQGLYQYSQVRAPSASNTSSSLAPTTSLRPRARPF